MTNEQTALHIIQMVKQGGGYLTKDGEALLQEMIHEPMQSHYSFDSTVNLDSQVHSDTTTAIIKVRK